MSIQDIKMRWEEFLAMPFPAGCAGLEVKGVCLVELEAYASGALGTYVGNDGRLDAHNMGILNDCVKELQIVTSDLTGDVRVYFERLQNLAVAVLNDLRGSHV
jgi:hypothetical protein